ncbi:HMG box-containing protein 1-like [Pholidichthys leucotaenia]
MVWEVVTPLLPQSDAKHLEGQESETRSEHTGMMTDADGDRSHDPLHCDEHFSSSPDFPTSDTFMEYDDLPDLQEVGEDSAAAAASIYQVGVGMSHQEQQAQAQHTQPPDTHWLIQLAHIATGPQSPLLQDPPNSSFSSSSVCIWGSSSDLHSYARPPPPLSSSTSCTSFRGPSRERRPSRTNSECSSAVSTRSSLSDDEDVCWSFSCPPTAWHCFLKGTHLRFHGSSNVEWVDVEGIERGCTSEEESTYLKSYGSEGLQLVEHSEVILHGQAILQLTFDPGAFGNTPLSSRCQLDHPFYVKNKGWSSFYPSLTVVQYGIPCYEMDVGDVCLPPGHRDAKHTDNSLVFDTFRSYDFTPLDSSAVYVLSSMARRRRASQSSGGTLSPDRETPRDSRSPSHSYSTLQKPARNQPVSVSRCKRPMNAFMLFAKKYRVEYTQMYPGKDNRAISVLLGERWKKMRSEERRTFTLQAKALADEQKRLNPDCWKRKRTNSGCQGN